MCVCVCVCVCIYIYIYIIQEEDKLLLLAGIFRSILLTSQVTAIKMIGLNDVLCVISYAETFLTVFNF